MVTPSGASVSSPSIGYVAKLGLVCSPSVTIGDPLASKRWTVSRIAPACSDRSLSREMRPAANSRTPATSSGGLGMLPIGSVGIGMRPILSARAVICQTKAVGGQISRAPRRVRHPNIRRSILAAGTDHKILRWAAGVRAVPTGLAVGVEGRRFVLRYTHQSVHLPPRARHLHDCRSPCHIG